MLHAEMKKLLKRLHLSQWLPMMEYGLFCIVSLVVAVTGADIKVDSFGGILMLLPSYLIPVCWVFTLAFAVENIQNALRMLVTADGLKHGTLRFMIRQLPQVIKAREDSEPDPGVLRTALRHKLAMLPYYALCFLQALALLAGLLNPWGLWFIPLVVGGGMVFAYLSLLATSGYVIAQVVLLLQQQKLTQAQCVVLAASQLLFVLDIPGCAYLCRRFAPTPAPPGNQSQASPAPGAAASSPPPPPRTSACPPRSRGCRRTCPRDRAPL